MEFRFQFERTLAAAAELLKTSPARRMNYMRLLKLLYIADREMLAQHAQPITGDRVVAMERGPVLSHTYELILGKTAQAADWSRFIRREHFEAVLAEDPGSKQLSKAVVAKLHEIAVRYEDMDEWAMVEETHKLAEWQKAYVQGTKSAYPIRWEDALIAQGKERLIPEVERDEHASALFDEMYGK